MKDLSSDAKPSTRTSFRPARAGNKVKGSSSEERGRAGAGVPQVGRAWQDASRRGQGARALRDQGRNRNRGRRHQRRAAGRQAEGAVLSRRACTVAGGVLTTARDAASRGADVEQAGCASQSLHHVPVADAPCQQLRTQREQTQPGGQARAVAQRVNQGRHDCILVSASSAAVMHVKRGMCKIRRVHALFCLNHHA